MRGGRLPPGVALAPTGRRRLDMRGASAVAAVRGALFLAEDDEGIYRARGGSCTLWAGRALHSDLGDLEGLAADTAGRTLWALAEETGAVIALSLARARSPRIVGHLPRPGRRTNKGYEGLAYLPARWSPNRRISFVAVHEDKPRRIGIFSQPGLEQTHDLKLTPAIKKVMADLADVTVDPVTGTLWLLSEESRRVAVVSVQDDTLVLHATIDLEIPKDARPEGLDFVSASRLVVVTEGPALALTYRVRRSAQPVSQPRSTV